MTTTRAALIAATLAALALTTGCSPGNEQLHTNCRIEDRMIIDGRQGDKRVITSCGTFSVNDGYGAGNRSFDRYAQLTPGTRWDIRTNGRRSGAASSFPNIIDTTRR
ncbi:hypothetical protein NONI108955_21065 [Nocardia ninae]|uniref:Lipoprotein n=1 Tax=Nocardia ninae NBRC 108245 TaxID=1210091 RepID=A0A511M9W2_9NOCA|nr:hypothetical protein [Nocardia ninae]GEM37445.1 hypothetical protein NN4_19640 [Nocardia ninae NBRC 108245]